MASGGKPSRHNNEPLLPISLPNSLSQANFDRHRSPSASEIYSSAKSFLKSRRVVEDEAEIYISQQEGGGVGIATNQPISNSVSKSLGPVRAPIQALFEGVSVESSSSKAITIPVPSVKRTIRETRHKSTLTQSGGSDDTVEGGENIDLGRSRTVSDLLQSHDKNVDGTGRFRSNTVEDNTTIEGNSRQHRQLRKNHRDKSPSLIVEKSMLKTDQYIQRNHADISSNMDGNITNKFNVSSSNFNSNTSMLRSPNRSNVIEQNEFVVIQSANLTPVRRLSNSSEPPTSLMSSDGSDTSRSEGFLVFHDNNVSSTGGNMKMSSQNSSKGIISDDSRRSRSNKRHIKKSTLARTVTESSTMERYQQLDQMAPPGVNSAESTPITSPSLLLRTPPSSRVLSQLQAKSVAPVTASAMNPPSIPLPVSIPSGSPAPQSPRPSSLSILPPANLSADPSSIHLPFPQGIPGGGGGMAEGEALGVPGPSSVTVGTITPRRLASHGFQSISSTAPTPVQVMYQISLGPSPVDANSSNATSSGFSAVEGKKEVTGAGQGVVGSDAEMEVVVKDAIRAKQNDFILQDRLQQAKAMSRKDDNGAVMHQFSLWSNLGKLSNNNPPNSNPSKQLIATEKSKKSQFPVDSGPGFVTELGGMSTIKRGSPHQFLDPLPAPSSSSSRTQHAESGSNTGKLNIHDSWVTSEANAEAVTATSSSGLMKPITQLPNSSSSFVRHDHSSSVVSVDSESHSNKRPAVPNSGGLASQLRTRVDYAKQLASPISPFPTTDFIEGPEGPFSPSRPSRKMTSRVSLDSFILDDEDDDDENEEGDARGDRKSISIEFYGSVDAGNDTDNNYDRDEEEEDRYSVYSVEEEEELKIMAADRHDSRRPDTAMSVQSIFSVMAMDDHSHHPQGDGQFKPVSSPDSAPLSVPMEEEDQSIGEPMSGRNSQLTSRKHVPFIFQSMPIVRSTGASPSNSSDRVGNTNINAERVPSRNEVKDESGRYDAKKGNITDFTESKKMGRSWEVEERQQVAEWRRSEPIPTQHRMQQGHDREDKMMIYQSHDHSVKSQEQSDDDDTNNYNTPSPSLSEVSDQESDEDEVLTGVVSLGDTAQSKRSASNRERSEQAQASHSDSDSEKNGNRNTLISWKKGQPIGEGTFGQVFKGMNEYTGELLALKQICLADGSDEEVEHLRSEIRLMKNLEHVNIVRYIGTDRSDRYLFILMEYVPGGSIASMLVQFGPFSEELMRRFIHQILKGVDYLHDRGIIHRDIKGANVLVTDAGVVKLADFGCSKQLAGMVTTTLEESLRVIRGSVPWMAPEVIKQTGLGRSADIWSVGATIIEMATGRHPWPEFTNNMAALFHVATSKEPPSAPTHLSTFCISFIHRCLVIDPKDRATAKELLLDIFVEPEETKAKEKENNKRRRQRRKTHRKDRDKESRSKKVNGRMTNVVVNAEIHETRKKAMDDTDIMSNAPYVSDYMLMSSSAPVKL